MKILITGAAGFIGYHLCEALVKLSFEIIGLDNINDYYDVNLKYERLERLGFKKESENSFEIISNSQIYGAKLKFIKMNLEDEIELSKLFSVNKFDYVCNLAAQAGVRYSLDNPRAYINSNIVGFFNVLECCKEYKVKRLLYASSSSVYGNNSRVPFKESEIVDEPVSIYAATKKSNELMAYTYSHLYNIETIGLRFFTVYGPLGRPDMAMFLFTDAIIKNKSIDIFNNGELSRDFTYISDIINGVVKIIVSKENYGSKSRIYNIGNSKPEKLLDFVEAIEDSLNKTANKNFAPMQSGDVFKTWADVTNLKNDYNYKSKVSMKKGVKKFINWYKEYYNK